MNKEYKEHPSYGAVQISQITSNNAIPFFGSSVKQSSFIRFRVMKNSVARDLSNDWYYANNSIIEFDLTPHQFAELFASMNRGNGVPCTLRFIVGEGHLPEPEFDSKREQFVNEFREDALEVSKLFDEAIAELESLIDKPSVTKADRKNLLSKLHAAKSKISSSMPFVAHQFNKQMDKTLHEVKLEAEAYLHQMVIDTGLAGLQANKLSIEDSSK